MARTRRRVQRDKRRFLLRDSDQSGFTYFRRELVKDGPWLVHPSEKDVPPPSKEPLGSEGDGTAVGIRANRTQTDMNPDVPDFA